MASYEPYVSGDDGTDTDSDGYTSEESLAKAPGKQPIVSGGPASLDESMAPLYNSGTKFETAESKTTSLFMINSRDRDTRVYPDPTFFTLRLPHTFKNVKAINIVQINLLNSFFNFSVVNGNTWMYVLEQGRKRTNPVTGAIEDNSIKVQIRDGTYTANELVDELNSSMNSTPLFADVTLIDFVGTFQTTGDYTPLFNTPGSVVYNNLTQTYDRNQTINNIVSRYFQAVQTVGTVSYSYNECSVAYYYPIIKEMIVETGTPTFDVSGIELPPGFSTWYGYLVFAFAGLNDKYVLSIINKGGNVTQFNNYRYLHTFNVSLVNRYNCTYNTKQGRLVINAPSLNESITNDLNATYANNLATLILANPLFSSVQQFSNSYNSISNANIALIDFYNFIQSRFSSNFGVDFGQYSAEFYSDSNNEINIYNTLNRYGWNLSLTPQVSSNVINSNATPAVSPQYWSNILIPREGSSQIDEGDFIPTLHVPAFTDDYLKFDNAGESQFGYVDISFSIAPTTYVRAAFKTRSRQNISIMTIPRYESERGAGTEMRYQMGPALNETPYLFDTANGVYYNRLDISGNILLNMYRIEQNMFYDSAYMITYDAWLNYMFPQILNGHRIQPDDPAYSNHPPASDIVITSYRPFICFQVDADKYLMETTSHFNITFTVETQSNENFIVPIVVTWYKDRAGFMADVQRGLVGDVEPESKRHYFKQQVYYKDVNTASMVVDVNNSQVTYFYIRVLDATNVPSAMPIRAYALLTDTYGDYVQQVPTDYYDMPYNILSTIYDQYTPASVIFADPTKSIYEPTVFKLGYDNSNVSNNLIDYVINTGSNYYDPNNIGDYINGINTGLQYQLRLATSGAVQPSPELTTEWSLYFGSNSQNVIYDTYNTTSNIYMNSNMTWNMSTTGAINGYITNWLSSDNSNAKEMYINTAPGAQPGFNSTIGNSSIFLVCNNFPPMTTDVSTSSTYIDISGINGVGFFLPPSECVKLNTMLIKFVYTQPSESGDDQYTRTNSAIDKFATGDLSLNQTSYTNTHNSPTDDWDDWYLYNRRNMKLGVFNTANVKDVSIATLDIKSAVCTLTLDKVTQVNNYNYQSGTKRSREPEWGTYYTYKFVPIEQERWDVRTPDWIGPSVPGTYWRSTLVTADFAQSTIMGDVFHENHFQTPVNIINYSYLPRSYGIAPAVGSSANMLEDINNSYTAVPFYYDQSDATWKVGSFRGISYTRTPVLPPASLIGAAPFVGPAGIYAFNNTAGVFKLFNGDAPTSTFIPYYWNMKIQYDILDVPYNPATDMKMFGGYKGITTEYQDTMLYLYANRVIKDDVKGIQSVVTYNNIQFDVWNWGLESNVNYNAFDDQNGYNYLSYIHDVSVKSKIKEYAVHVRAYDPIPRFNTGIRFIGKNLTDFGRPSLWEMAEEISTLGKYMPINDETGSYYSQILTTSNDPSLYNAAIRSNDICRSTSSAIFSHAYADSLINFNRTFSTSAVFGKKVGYNGVSFIFDGFPSAISSYVSYFSTIRDNLGVYTRILSTASGELYSYINTRYGDILPSTIINRSKITDPLPYQLLFKSKLESPYTDLSDQWGLGYNLGFAKADTYPPRTTVVSDTFIKIVEDYIYLRMNPEYNINALSVSGKECRECCQDSAGEDNKYFSKILLSGFGGFSRAAVQLPKQFNPVLGKYETVSCQLVDRLGNQIVNKDCEYDFVLEITEITNATKDSSSLIGPK